MAKTISDHLHDKANWDAMFPWDKLHLPKTTDDIDYIKTAAENLIKKQIGRESEKCLKKNDGKGFRQKILDDVIYQELMIEQKKSQFMKIMQKWGIKDDKSKAEENETEQLNHESAGDMPFGKGTVAAVAITAPLWFPIALVAGLIAIPSGLVFIAIRNKIKKEKYKENPKTFMNNWAAEFLNTYGEKNVCVWLNMTQFETLEQKLDETDQETKAFVKSCTTLLSNLESDTRSNESICRKYAPKLAQCRSLLGKLANLYTN